MLPQLPLLLGCSEQVMKERMKQVMKEKIKPSKQGRGRRTHLGHQLIHHLGLGAADVGVGIKDGGNGLGRVCWGGEGCWGGWGVWVGEVQACRIGAVARAWAAGAPPPGRRLPRAAGCLQLAPPPAQGLGDRSRTWRRPTPRLDCAGALGGVSRWGGQRWGEGRRVVRVRGEQHTHARTGLKARAPCPAAPPFTHTTPPHPQTHTHTHTPSHPRCSLPRTCRGAGPHAPPPLHGAWGRWGGQGRGRGRGGRLALHSPPPHTHAPTHPPTLQQLVVVILHLSKRAQHVPQHVTAELVQPGTNRGAGCGWVGGWVGEIWAGEWVG